MMVSREPLILVTNDDGIRSPGLVAAAEAVAGLGELLIACCAEQQTAMSRSFPKGARVGAIDETEILVEGTPTVAYAVEGSPALAVSHAVLELAGRVPTLCVSGVNYGENIGLTLTGSGTIGAALEADSYGIPSLAVSLEASVSAQHSSEFTAGNWIAAKHFARFFATAILARGLPDGAAIANLNLPSDATPTTEVRNTSVSRQNYFVFERPNRTDRTRPLRLPVSVEFDKATLEADSDIRAVAIDRVISMTLLTSTLNAGAEWILEEDEPRLDES